MVVSYKIKHKWTVQPRNTILGMYPREMKIYVTKDLSMNTFCSIIPKSQKLETTDMSINGRMSKQAVVYTYNGILFNNKKEWIINTLLPHG